MSAPSSPVSTNRTLSHSELSSDALTLGECGYWLVQLDNLRIEHISTGFYPILGFTEEEGLPDTFAEWLAQCHTTDRTAFQSLIDDLTRLPRTRAQLRIRNQFGIWTWLEVTAQVQAADPSYALLVFHDVTRFKEIESAALDSQIRYHSLYNYAPLALILWNREGLITGWNTYAERMFGWREPEVIGKKIHHLLLPKDQVTWFSEQIRCMLRHEGEGRFSSHVQTKTGKSLRCDWSNVPLRNTQGQFLGIMSLLQDVTDQWYAQSQFREIAHMYRALVETSPDAILLADPQGQVMMANQQCGQLFALEHFGDLVGRPLLSCVASADQAAFQEKVLSPLSDYVGFVERRPFTLERTDHSTFSAELSYTASAGPDGEATGLIVIIRDITEQLERNQELADHRFHLESLVKARTQEVDVAYQKLAQILEGSPVPTFVLAPDGSVTHWNHACEQLLETPAEQVVGKRETWKALYTDQRPLLVELVLQNRADEIATWYGADCRPSQLIQGAYEVESFFPEHQRWLQFTAKALHDQQGNIIGAIETLLDITERKAAEKALIEARDMAESLARMKADFLANMSHELRTPMNAVIGIAHLLQKTVLSPRQQEYVRRIHTAGTQLLHVVNDVLDFSKIEAGRMQLDNAPFNLEETLDNAIGLVLLAARDKGLQLHCSLAADVPLALQGDALRLSQVLTNLLSNAVKFTRAGYVSVQVNTLNHESGRVQLEIAVKDTGIGMDEGQRSKLFQAFTQADTSITRQFGGTGLGLVISRKLIELMEGDIALYSEPGIGSVFTFTVWLSTTPSNTSLPHIHARALVVDDLEVSRRSLVNILKQAGLDVAEAHNQESALALCQSSRESFDWFFLEEHLPSLPLIEQLQAHHRTLGKSPRYVILTHAAPENFDDLIHHGKIQGILSKPFFLHQTLALLDPMGNRQHSENKGKTLEGLSVLVAEDIPTNQMIIQDLLNGMGAKVTLADHGQMAVDILTMMPNKFHLVLMDVQMPVMDGLAATQKIRAELSKTLPILAMTAHALDEGRKSCEEAGMNDFLTKPISPPQLENTLFRWWQTLKQNSSAQVPPSPSADTTTASPPLAAPSVPTPPTVVADVSQWQLPGIDIADGLRRMVNKPALYEKVLRDFHRRFNTEMERIQADLDNSQDNEAKRRLHSLKGLAGSISATRLFELAAQAETALKDNQATQAALEALQAELKIVMDGIATQFALQ